MNRRTFMGVNTMGALGSALPVRLVSAETKRNNTIREPSQELDIIDSADIIILGGGPAGCAAAVAAGRLGADVLLVERYGYLGGLSTGGLVILIGEYDRRMTGLPNEFVNRFLESGEARFNEYINRRVPDEPICNPEMLKYTYFDMAEKAGVRFLFHAWAVGAHVVGDRIEGIIIESKSGRQGLRGKLIIDCTGDGDTAQWAGVPYENTISSWSLGLDELLTNVDFDRFRHFMKYKNEEWKKLIAEAREAEVGWAPWETWRNDMAWINTSSPGDALNVKDITNCEINLRKRLMKHLDFFRKNMPGFENATVNQTASQIGVRVSRRIIGEVVMTVEDLKAGKYEDRIAMHLIERGGELKGLPYRALVPRKINNLLYAGRCVSTTQDAQNIVRGISACWMYGQAAGVAATLSVQKNRPPRDLEIGTIQAALRRQGVKI